jgi:hypothetical protein
VVQELIVEYKDHVAADLNTETTASTDEPMVGNEVCKVGVLPIYTSYTCISQSLLHTACQSTSYLLVSYCTYTVPTLLPAPVPTYLLGHILAHLHMCVAFVPIGDGRRRSK